MRTRDWTGVLALAACATAGCTGGGAEPRNDMGAGETAAAGQAIAAAGHANARDFRLAGDGTGFAGGCSTTLPASPADADNDHLPDVSTIVTYSSCPEGGFTFSGTQILQDADPGAASFNFNSVWSIDSTGTVGGNTVSVRYDGTIAAAGGTSGTFSLSDSAEVVTTISGPDVNGSIDDSHAWTVQFTPDDGVWTPVPGLPLEDGDFSVSGAWDVTFSSGGNDVQITGLVSTPSALRTSAACASSIVSGVVQVLVTEPEQGTLTVTWTGCGSIESAFASLGL